MAFVDDDKSIANVILARFIARGFTTMTVDDVAAAVFGEQKAASKPREVSDIGHQIIDDIAKREPGR